MRKFYRSGIVVLSTVIVVAGALVAFDLMSPPNLSRYHDGSVEVRAAQGQLLRAFLSDDDKWRLHTGPEDVDPRYLQFLLAYEDKRFARHWGVSFLAIARASVQWVSSGKIISGASTLTMQTARLLEPRKRGVRAKIIQVARAFQLERRYSKRDILSIYLSLAPFGGNLEGVRSASLAYLGKEPNTLTNAEIALLVALPQSPERFRPDRSVVQAQLGRDKVLRRMAAHGLLSQQALAEALAETLPETRLEMPFMAPRFAARIASHHVSSETVVKTTLDWHLQSATEALASHEKVWMPDAASMAFLVVHNPTRQIRAYVGGVDFWSLHGQVDLVRAVRSPGSTLKPFIYAQAFDELPLHPETIMRDEPMIFSGYAPQNFDQNFVGMISVREALQRSLNVPAVAVLDKLGAHRFAALMKAGGANFHFQSKAVGPSLPIALGGVGINLHDLAQLYVGLANGGVSGPIINQSGLATGQERRIFSERAAWYVTDILQGSPMPQGWARGVGIHRSRKIAFKTGTSFGYRDAWAVGYSHDYTVAVWVGRPDGAARSEHVGRNTAAPLVFKIFDLLPAEIDSSSQPRSVLSVSSAHYLPATMQRFIARDGGRGHSRSGISAPQIAFPPDGAVLVVGADSATRDIELRVNGGRAPIRWLVDGELLPATRSRFAPAIWRVSGVGFVRLVAVDADGQTAQAEVRVRASDVAAFGRGG